MDFQHVMNKTLHRISSFLLVRLRLILVWKLFCKTQAEKFLSANTLLLFYMGAVSKYISAWQGSLGHSGVLIARVNKSIDKYFTIWVKRRVFH